MMTKKARVVVASVLVGALCLTTDAFARGGGGGGHGGGGCHFGGGGHFGGMHFGGGHFGGMPFCGGHGGAAALGQFCGGGLGSLWRGPFGPLSPRPVVPPGLCRAPTG